MPSNAFTSCRDHSTYAVYCIHAALPVTVAWPSGRQTLRIRRFPYPPHLSLEFESDEECREAGCVYELECPEHGELLVRHGFKVASPSALDLFCARLVQEGRATLLAGRHSEVPWASHVERVVDRRHPETCLDAFWTWRQWTAEPVPRVGRWHLR